MRNVVTVIADIVESRKLENRAEAQVELESLLAECEEAVVPLARFQPTVGDEFQAVFAGLGEARHVLLQVKLGLPTGLDLRFGLGVGSIERVGQTHLQDGPGWWSARTAIEETERRAAADQSWLRTWVMCDRADEVVEVNRALITEDFIISKMKAREKRLALMALRGVPQKEAAAAERISQSAVSQSLQRSGAAALISADALSREAE